MSIKNFKVYMHTNKINGKKYIGITSMSISKRWGIDGIGYKTQIFYRSIEKYGWDNFFHEVLFDNLTEQEAKKKEIDLINIYKTNNKRYGYNQTIGGDSISEKTREKISEANSKRIISDETRLKMSKTRKGRKVSDKTKRKLSLSKIGFKHSQESKLKMSKNHPDVSGENNPMYGKKFTQEHIEKIRNALSGRKLTEEQIDKLKGKTGELSAVSKRVMQFSLNGEFIKEYVNITEASKRTGAIRQHISKCCNGERNQTGGYKWSYSSKD